MPGTWGVVVAGGSGERFGAPKQFALLGGRPVLEWSVAACRPSCAHVVLVLPAGHAALSQPHPPYGADVVVSGGATRAESVRAGLAPSTVMPTSWSCTTRPAPSPRRRSSPP